MKKMKCYKNLICKAKVKQNKAIYLKISMIKKKVLDSAFFSAQNLDFIQKKKFEINTKSLKSLYNENKKSIE